MANPSKLNKQQSLNLSHLAVEALRRCILAVVALLEGHVDPEEVPVECGVHQAEVLSKRIEALFTQLMNVGL